MVLQIERDGFAPYRKAEPDGRAQSSNEEKFVHFAQVSLDGAEVKLTGGGCDQTIPLEKK